MSDAKKKKGAGRKRRADSLREGRWQRKIDATPRKMLEMKKEKWRIFPMGKQSRGEKTNQKDYLEESMTIT